METSKKVKKNTSASLKGIRQNALKDLYHLFDDVPFAVAVLMGESLKVEFINKYNLAIWQRIKEEVLGKPLFEVYPGNSAGIEPIHQQVYQTGERFTANELPLEIWTNGKPEIRWYSTTIDPLRNENGRIIGQMATTIDISEQVIARHKILENENRYRNLIEETTVATAVLEGPDLVVTLANDRMLQIWRRDKSIIGKKLLDSIPELIGQSFPELLQSVYETGITYSDQDALTVLNRGGKLEDVYMDFSYKALRHVDGEIYAVLVSANDVTERSTAQRKIEESEQRFRSMANDTPAFMFMADAQTNVEFVNRQWLDFVGLNSKEGVGQAWVTITHPDDVAPMFAIYSDAVANMKPYQFEIRQKRTDGIYRWVLWKGIPRKTIDGKFGGMLGIGVDISEQKEGVELLRESESRFRTLVNSISQLAWIADGDGWIYWYNDRWYEYTGTTFEEMQGWGWEKVHHPEHVKGVVDFVAHAWQKPEPFELTFPLRSAAGEYRWFLTRAYPILNGEEKIIQWIGTNTDIHDQKTMEERLEELVEKRTRELQQSNENLQQFAHVASHDLKEPVRKIKTFLSRLESELGDLLDERNRIYVNKVHSATDRMFKMIDGVLTYSTINASDQPSQLVDLNEVIRNIESDLEVVIQQTGATILYNDLPVLSGAPVLLYQLFYNLINNSVKFAKAGMSPVISIESKIVFIQDRDFAQIILRDNGIGFEQEQAKKIFDTFTRLNAKDKYEGTGLGLALCKKIVERHGGKIEAESTIKEGATFIINLPLEQNGDNI